MKRKYLTDSEVEIEIERLKKSEDVLLAKEEIRIKNKRRQYMYCLRNMEKRGKQLKLEGMTFERLRKLEKEV